MRIQKRKKVIIILVLLLFGISLGYALLSSNLNITGTTSLSSNTWNIHWSNLAVTNGSVSGTKVTTPAAIKTGNTEVEYSITLSTPGDFYEFTVDAVNEGSIDAMIESFSNKTYESNGTTEKNLPSYLNYSVTYNDGIALANKQKLDANTTEKIKVRVEFKKDIESSELPTTVDTIAFKFNVVYVQADNTAISVNHPKIVYSANNYDSNVTGNNSVRLNQAFPESITQYQTPSDALTAIAAVSSKNLPFYLKHKIENGVVAESYVEFVVTPEMAAANTGMVAGTYTLRGGINEESLTDPPIFIQNSKTIYDAFGSICSTNPYTTTITSSPFQCNVSGLSVAAYTTGRVYASDTSGTSCSVGSSGSSNCSL